MSNTGSETALAYVRSYYGVPTRAGVRILFAYTEEYGTIVGGEGQYLLVRFDGHTAVSRLHPTWEVDYAADCSHMDVFAAKCLDCGLIIAPAK